MRPVRLEMAAFGPYPGVEVVDFEELSRLGTFVVSGPTGVGKTTIFDAMCFALFGRLPGFRGDQDGGQDRVRSDFAEPGTLTRVRFEFLVGGDLWRVEREPRQLRPRLKGTGTANHDHNATLSRFVDGGWMPEEARVTEVAKRSVQLIGLDATQFQQVILLPQGRFQQFLDANTDQRRLLLRSLFRSRLYADIEAEVEERARAARQDAAGIVARAEQRLTDAEAGLAELRQGLDPDEAVGASAEAPVSEAPTATSHVSMAERVAEAGRTLDAIVAGPLHRGSLAIDEANAVADAAAEEARRARDAAGRIAELARLRAESAALEVERPEREAAAARVAAARRAAPAMEALGQVEAADGEVARARADHEATRGRSRDLLEAVGWQDPGDTADTDRLSKLATSCTEAAERHRSAAQRLTEAAGHRAAATEADGLIAEARGRIAEQESAAAAAEGRARAASEERVRVEGVAAELVPARARLEDVRRRAERARRRDEAGSRIGRLESEHREELARLGELGESHATAAEQCRAAAVIAADTAQREVQLKEAMSRLEDRRELTRAEADLAAARAAAVEHRRIFESTLEAYVASAAPRLAERLRGGDPCPVCGSEEHPAPARPREGTELVDADALESARVATDAAEVLARNEEARVARLAHVHGMTEVALVAEVAAAEAAVVEAVAAGRNAAKLEAHVGSLASKIERAEARAGALLAEKSELQGLVQALLAELDADAARPLTELESEDESAAVAVEAAESAVRRVAELDELIGGENAARDEAREKGDAERLVEAKAEATARTARATAQAIEDDVRAQVGEGDHAKLADRLARAAAAVARRRDALVAVESSMVRRSAAEANAIRRLTEDGWASEEEARAAAMDPAECAALDEAVQTWRTRAMTVAGKLEALEAQELPQVVEDVAVLEQRNRDAKAEAARILAAHSKAEERAAVVRRGLDAVGRLLEDGGRAIELQDRWDRIEAVCRKADNHLGADIETWVLVTYLEQVLEMANGHLEGMTAGRYRLVLGDESGRRVKNRALDVVVEDAAAGRYRIPQQLSGGERFQVALSLAMGLSDVVRNQGDAAPVEALFIDEGFGTLDVDAQQQAVGVLEQLPQRGLMVGVITHVEAVKEALGIGLEVRRLPGGGSTIVSTSSATDGVAS